jgi:hypothetical protein
MKECYCVYFWDINRAPLIRDKILSRESRKSAIQAKGGEEMIK